MLNKERVALKARRTWLHFISAADIGRLTQHRTSSLDVIFRILRGSPIHRAFSARRNWEFLPGPNSPGSNLVCASRLNAETTFQLCKVSVQSSGGPGRSALPIINRRWPLAVSHNPQSAFPFIAACDVAWPLWSAAAPAARRLVGQALAGPG